jgi:hypothetical protein
MDQVGFFKTDASEAAQVLADDVLPKKRIGGPEGLEICPAKPDGGLRRMQALNRMDIPTMWRAMIRRPDGKKVGPSVSLLAPRGRQPAEAAQKLADAGLVADGVADNEGYTVTFAPDTPPADLVQFSVRAMEAIGSLGLTGEWQWTVRKKGVYPR